MAEFPSLPLFTDAYLSDTRHLSTIEHGTYLLLLICMWRSKAVLKNDDKFLAKISGLSPSQWKRIKPTIFDFFVVNDQTITQQRLTDEYAFVRQRSKAQSSNARARWLKTKETGNANAYAKTVSGSTPTPTPTPTSIKRDTNVSQKRATQIPKEWADDPPTILSEKNMQHALNSGMTPQEASDETYKFRDWAEANGKTYKNWDAAWRTRCNNFLKFNANRQSNQGSGQLRIIANAARGDKIPGMDWGKG